MKFAHEVRIAAPAERVYRALLDVPRVSSCLPGASDVRGAGDRYDGKLGVQLGPIRLSFDGEVAIVERDDAARAATLRATGEDRLSGGVRALITLRAEDAAGATRLLIDSDVQVLGRIGQLGFPIMKRKADQLITAFGACLATELAT